MMKAMNRFLAIGALVLCCLLFVCATEAQNVAREALWSSDKLGLTPDQKAKLEAVQKDVESQRQALLENRKLGGDERAARLLEINENERAHVKDILTPAQQRKLKDLMYPREHWGVSGCIYPGKTSAHYRAELDGYPSAYLSYTIQKRNIRLRALDANGKPVADGPCLTLADSVPDVIKPVANWRGSSVCEVEFVLDRKTARPGLYLFELRAAVDATDVETRERVKLRDVVASGRVYVTPQPDYEPALRPGQRFIGTPWEKAAASTATPYRDVKSGKRITWREIVTRIATLQRSEPSRCGSRLTFVLEGHTGQVFLETERPVTDLPYLTPLLTEPTVRSLKAQYEGKLVWCYGGPGGQCVTTEPGLSVGMSGRLDVPLRVRRVERVCIPPSELAIGNATFIGGERESAFLADNPLVVILDAPAKGLEFSGLSYVGEKDVGENALKAASGSRGYCLGLWNMVSDRWDFEREYSLSNPLKAWPARMRKAVLKGELVKGMTREMVAWVLGWPSMYGTKSEMLGLDDWAYDNIPSSGHVYFKDGRMVEEYWPRLP